MCVSARHTGHTFTADVRTRVEVFVFQTEGVTFSAVESLRGQGSRGTAPDAQSAFCAAGGFPQAVFPGFFGIRLYGQGGDE